MFPVNAKWIEKEIKYRKWKIHQDGEKNEPIRMLVAMKAAKKDKKSGRYNLQTPLFVQNIQSPEMFVGQILKHFMVSCTNFFGPLR